jgi:hypothetical protein
LPGRAISREAGSRTKFGEWYDGVKAAAPQTATGRLAVAAGFHVAHTGGGCLLDDGRYLWVCDEGNGLGERFDEPFLVGFYDSEGESIDGDTMPSLKVALEWCECRINP